MRFFFKLIIILFFTNITSTCDAGSENGGLTKKWLINDIGTISSFDNAHPIDFSDNGQVLFCCDQPGKIDRTYGIGAPESGMILLPELPKRQGESDTQVIWKRIDSSGRVIGIKSMTNVTRNGFYPILVTWSPQEGLLQYKFDSSVQSRYHLAVGGAHDTITIGQCENSNKIVITFDGKMYVLKNNNIIDVTNQIETDFKIHGFSFYKLKWNGLAINDNETIFGVLECYSKHPFKDTPILETKKVFLWQPHELLLFDISYKEFDDLHYYLNNNNKASFNVYGDKAYIWDMKSNSLEDATFISEADYNEINSELAVPITYHNLKIKSILSVLDDDTIVTSLNDGGVLLKNGNDFYYLNHSESIKYIAENKYPGVKINGLCGYYFPVVNGGKAICVSGVFINEDHPFVIMLE